MSDRGYADLVVWQKAMDWVEAVYVALKHFPPEELYALGAQLRRSAVSVPSNIAEGKGRHGNKEFRQYLYQARGSLLEAETQVKLAQRLGYVNSETANGLCARSEEVGRLLNGLINSIP